MHRNYLHSSKQKYHKLKTLHGKPYFLFPDVLKRCYFQKKSRWNMIFFVFSGKIMFLIPENMILHLDGKWKMIFLKKKTKKIKQKKKTRKYDISFKLSEKIVFSKRAAPGNDLSCIIWKHSIFFLGQEVRDDLSQKIHGNTIFSVYTYGCCKLGVTPLCQSSKMVLSRKNTPKDDWRSRLKS